MIPPSTLMLAGLSISCWLSFAWAIIHHFARPNSTSWRMKAMAILGTLFGLWQITSIMVLPTVRLPSWISAVILYGVAHLLFWWAVSATRAHRLSLAFTLSSPQSVLDQGPYQWIRHPFYASYILYWMAGVFAAQAWWLTVSVLIMGSLYWNAASREEAEFLQSDQAEIYQTYINRTWGFFPQFRWNRSAMATAQHRRSVSRQDPALDLREKRAER